MTAPTVSNAGALTQMKEKAEGWIAQAKSGNLHKRNMLFLSGKQFWPKVAYGISTISASFQELDECLMRTYCDLLPLNGVRKSIRKELRQLDSFFLWCWLPTSRSRVLVRAGVKTHFTLWKFLGDCQTYEGIHEVIHNRGWNISSTFGRAVQLI
jgi:hypothetical protein